MEFRAYHIKGDSTDTFVILSDTAITRDMRNTLIDHVNVAFLRAGNVSRGMVHYIHYTIETTALGVTRGCIVDEGDNRMLVVPDAVDTQRKARGDPVRSMFVLTDEGFRPLDNPALGKEVLDIAHNALEMHGPRVLTMTSRNMGEIADTLDG